MNPFEPRKLGKTDVAVTALGLGGTGVAGMYKAVSEKDAIGTVERAWDAGVRYFDVAPFYGFGRGEIIYGRVLKHRPRDEFVLSTKVGRIVHHGKRPPGNRDPAIFPAETETYSEFDFRPEGVTRSFEDSLQRLGLKRIDVLYIHDPDLASSAREVMELRAHAKIKSHFPRRDCIIPIWKISMPLKLNLCQLSIRNFVSFFVFLAYEIGFHFQTSCSFRCPNKLKHRFESL